MRAPRSGAYTAAARVRSLLALGCGYSKPEDTNGNGRLLLFEILPAVEAATTPAGAVTPAADGAVDGAPAAAGAGAGGSARGAPGGRARLQLVCAHPMRAHVTAVAQLRGMLLAAVGTRIILFTLRDEHVAATAAQPAASDSRDAPAATGFGTVRSWGGLLEPVGIHDVALWTTSLSTLKSYVLAADALQSVRLLVWSEASLDFQTLSTEAGRAASASCADFMTVREGDGHTHGVEDGA